MRTLSADAVGLNGEAVTARSELWSDPGFLAAVARLRPRALRIFGGTTANYWDWRRGTFVVAAHEPPALLAARGRVHLPLSVWARLVTRARATPVFDLNLVTSSLPEQLAMLRAARRLGLAVRRVELGNELYRPEYRTHYPSGAHYGRVATRWIRAIRAEFPGVLIGAVGYVVPDGTGPPSTARERDWNAGVLRTLRGADALTFHPYFRSGLGPNGGLTDARAVATMLISPARRWAATRREALDALPRGTKAWMTEWNLFDRQAPVHGTWAQGLTVAAFALDLLSDPRVDQLDAHALVASAPFGAVFAAGNGLSFGPGIPAALHPAGRPGGASPAAVVHVAGFTVAAHRPPATTTFGLSAVGMAMAELLSASRGADRAQRLAFRSSGPSTPATAPKVQGEIFWGAHERSALVVNPEPVRVNLRVPPGLAIGRFEQRWGTPSTLVWGAGAIRRRAGRLGAGSSVSLPAYSITSLRR